MTLTRPLIGKSPGLTRGPSLARGLQPAPVDVSPPIDFDDTNDWTVAGTGASSNDTSFSASGSAVGALAKPTPCVVGKSYYYEIAYTITAGDLQIVNGTTTTPIIAQKTGSGVMKGYFIATNVNFRLRATEAATVTVSTLILKRLN